MYPQEWEVDERIAWELQNFDEEERKEIEEGWRQWSFNVALATIQGQSAAKRLFIVVIVCSILVSIALVMVSGARVGKWAFAISGINVLLLFPLCRVLSNRISRSYLREYASFFTRSVQGFRAGSLIISFLATHDPRFADAVGKPIPRFNREKIEFNWLLFVRMARWILSPIGTAAVLVLMGIFIVAALELGWANQLGWVTPAVILLIGVFLVKEHSRTKLKSSALQLQTMLVKHHLFLSPATAQNLVLAYRSRRPEASRFWTRRALAELFEKRDDLSDIERREIISGLVHAQWRQWWQRGWKRELPLEAKEVFDDYT